MTLEELQKVALEKYHALEAIKLARYKMEQELEAEVRQKVKEKYGEAENKASAEYAEADQALKVVLEKTRVAESESKIPFPVGTKMVFWERDRWSDSWRTPCVYGILQVFKKGDEYPSNLRWDAPQPGDIIVRLQNKKGELCKKFDKYRITPCMAWIPEGQYPKELK